MSLFTDRPRIVNISCSFQLESRVDFEILQKTLNCKPVKKKFKAIVFKIESPKATFNIYENGKVILCGIKNDQDIYLAIKLLTEKLEKSNNYFNLKINNKVLSGQFRSSINLKKIYNTLNGKYFNKYFPSYEQEIFPGLIIHHRNSKIRMTMFRNGKYFLTGSNEENEIVEIFNEINKLIQNVF